MDDIGLLIVEGLSGLVAENLRFQIIFVTIFIFQLVGGSLMEFDYFSGLVWCVLLCIGLLASVIVIV
jgi:hypothetical protein